MCTGICTAGKASVVAMGSSFSLPKLPISRRGIRLRKRLSLPVWTLLVVATAIGSGILVFRMHPSSVPTGDGPEVYGESAYGRKSKSSGIIQEHDSPNRQQVGGAPAKGIDLVHAFLQHYGEGRTDAMDNLSGDHAKYRSLLSSGMPPRLANYIVDCADPGHPRCYHVIANDPDGSKIGFAISTNQDETQITRIVVDPRDRAWRAMRGAALTSMDKVSIIQVLLAEGEQRDALCVDFAVSRNYRGYAAVGVTYWDTSEVAFFRLEGERWRHLMSTTEPVLPEVLDAMQLPADVRSVVWRDGYKATMQMFSSSGHHCD